MTVQSRSRLKIGLFVGAAVSFISGIIVAGGIGSAGGPRGDGSAALILVAGLVLLIPMVLVMLGTVVAGGNKR